MVIGLIKALWHRNIEQTDIHFHQASQIHLDTVCLGMARTTVPISQSQPCTAAPAATSQSGHRSASSLEFRSLVQESIYINSLSIMNTFFISSFLSFNLRIIFVHYLLLNDFVGFRVPQQSQQPFTRHDERTSRESLVGRRLLSSSRTASLSL